MSEEQKHTIEALFDLVDERKGADPKSSYTAKLFSRGRGKIAQKLGEEAVETVIAALHETREDLIAESADLLYHLTVLWSECDVTPEDVWDALENRRGTSGIEEKKARPES